MIVLWICFHHHFYIQHRHLPFCIHHRDIFDFFSSIWQVLLIKQNSINFSVHFLFHNLAFYNFPQIFIFLPYFCFRSFIIITCYFCYFVLCFLCKASLISIFSCSISVYTTIIILVCVFCMILPTSTYHLQEITLSMFLHFFLMIGQLLLFAFHH